MNTPSETSIKIALGIIVREHRERLHLSQEKLAERAGVHRTYVSDIEAGNRNVAVVNIVKLAFALNVTPSELLSTFIETANGVEANEHK